MKCNAFCIGVLLIVSLSRFASAGQPVHVWSRSFDGSVWIEGGNCVAFDGDGNVILTGEFRGIWDYGIWGEINLGGGWHVGREFENGFAAKYSPGGVYLWSISISSEDAGQNYGDIAVDAAGNILLIREVLWGVYDDCLEKFTPDGDLIWRKRIISSHQVVCKSIVIDPAGDIFLLGSFQTSVDLSDMGGGIHTSMGSVDIFLAKIDSTGSLIWSRSYGGPELDGSKALAVDDDGNIILAGRFRQEIDFGGGPLPWFGGPNGDDIFLAKLNTDGDHIWSQSFGSKNNGCDANAVAVDMSGAILLTGTFEQSIDFGGGELISEQGVYFAKFDESGGHLWSQLLEFPIISLLINPSGEGYAMSGGGEMIEFNANGEILWEGDCSSDDHTVSWAALHGNGSLGITGYLLNPVDFGGGALTHYLRQDAYVAIFDTSVVSAVLDTYSAAYRNAGVEVSWRLSDGGDMMKFYFLRSEGLADSYYDLKDPEVKREGLHFTLFDRTVEPGQSYRYRVDVSDEDGRRALFETETIQVPDASLIIHNSYPNPFNPATNILYSIPSDGAVRLEVYDTRGRLVVVLVNEMQRAGGHMVTWNGRDAKGRDAASGIYFLRLKSSGKTHTKKITLLK